ncbi:MAG TPA: hypothetical protein VKT52_10285 [Ktedonobacterales bacterium]|nr:hypothetical protein [Ktedonobacterales bacterium]
MPHDHDWHGPYGGPPWSPFDHFVAAGLSALFWLVVLVGITWAVMHYLRWAQAAQTPAISEEPSAMELLRRRYVMGQLDVDSFEEMVTHLLASEERERAFAPPLDERSWRD